MIRVIGYRSRRAGKLQVEITLLLIRFLLKKDLPITLFGMGRSFLLYPENG